MATLVTRKFMFNINKKRHTRINISQHGNSVRYNNQDHSFLK